MSPEDLIRTSLLLGAFVLLAGLYGLLYSVGMLFKKQGLFRAGQVSFGLQCLVTVAIVLLTPLAPPWKVLVVVSSAIYFCIPPVTWRYLQQIHAREGED